MHIGARNDSARHMDDEHVIEENFTTMEAKCCGVMEENFTTMEAK